MLCFSHAYSVDKRYVFTKCGAVIYVGPLPSHPPAVCEDSDSPAPAPALPGAQVLNSPDGSGVEAFCFRSSSLTAHEGEHVAMHLFMTHCLCLLGKMSAQNPRLSLAVNSLL